MNDDQIKRVQHIIPCFTSIPYNQWQAASLITANPLTPHAIREGHSLQHAMFIVSGSIRVFKISASGREVTLYRVLPGQCCVLMMASILGDTEYEASVAIEAESEVLLLPVHLFRDWVNSYKPVRQFIYRQFMDRMTRVTALLEQIAFYSVPYRLAEYLLAHTTDLPSGASLTITQEQLAIELGTAREVVSRVLKQWASLGVIASGRGRITVADRAMLTEIRDQCVT